MPARGWILVSALGPSSLFVPRGRGHCRRLGHHRVIPSVGGSLPSWILGNPVAVSSVHLVISYVRQQKLNHFPHAAIHAVTVPSWAYVSHQLLCRNLISFLLTLLINLHPQMLTTNIFMMCWPCYVCSLRTRCDSLSGYTFCPIVLCVTARDNQRRCMVRRPTILRETSFIRWDNYLMIKSANSIAAAMHPVIFLPLCKKLHHGVEVCTCLWHCSSCVNNAKHGHS
jgi:hypothetical protein